MKNSEEICHLGRTPKERKFRKTRFFRSIFMLFCIAALPLRCMIYALGSRATKSFVCAFCLHIQLAQANSFVKLDKFLKFEKKQTRKY